MGKNMVKDVSYTVGDVSCECKMLYLTNNQAAEIDLHQMNKVREAMDILEPKLVIRLMPSRYGKVFWEAFPHYFERFPTKQLPEPDDRHESDTDHQIMLLAKKVLLPLAMETNALVIGTESCSLTAAFTQACAPLSWEPQVVIGSY